MGRLARPELTARRWVREKMTAKRDEAIKARKVPDLKLIADAVAKEIRAAEAGSDPAERETAIAVIEIGLRYYVVQRGGDICRTDHVVGAVTWNGELATAQTPTRASVPPRDQNGARRQGAGTYPLWIDLPRKEYFAKLAEDEAAHDAAGRSVALWQRGAALLRKYPKAKTLRQACRFEGLDVATFLATP